MDTSAFQEIAARFQIISLYHDAGAREEAKAALDRATRLVDGLYDAGAARAAIGRVTRDVDELVMKSKGEAMDGVKVREEEAAFVCELSAGLVEQCLALGEKEQARARVRRILEVVEPAVGPSLLIAKAELGSYLAQAGDHEAGFALMRASREAMRVLPQNPARSLSLIRLVSAHQEAGDLDGALSVVRDLPPAEQQKALTDMMDRMSIDERLEPWLDTSGIKVTVGNPGLRPKDPAAARNVLPKIADAARAAGDARVEARTLATVAVLQARAGDVTGALATARSIPELKRSAYSGPPDGFYDAVKPAALALVAGVIAKAGDQTRADAALSEAEALARTVAPADQKLVAWVVVGRTYAQVGRTGAARRVAAEAFSLAVVQQEPRRSRVLVMLARVQADSGNLDEVRRTADVVRDAPGAEKLGAMLALARAYDDAGDAAAATAVRRRMIALLNARPSASGQPADVFSMQGVSRDLFIDYDKELPATSTEPMLASLRQALNARLDGEPAFLRDAKALPPARRAEAMVWAVGSRVQHGDPAGALELASTIEPAEARLRALNNIAATISLDRAKR